MTLYRTEWIYPETPTETGRADYRTFKRAMKRAEEESNKGAILVAVSKRESTDTDKIAYKLGKSKQPKATTPLAKDASVQKSVIDEVMEARMNYWKKFKDSILNYIKSVLSSGKRCAEIGYGNDFFISEGMCSRINKIYRNEIRCWIESLGFKTHPGAHAYVGALDESCRVDASFLVTL